MAASIVSTDPGEARAVALWTLGKVNYEQGDLPQARKCMRQAISVSRKYRLPRLEGAVLVSLAAVLVEIGRTADALRMLDQAQPLATGLEVGRLEQQRAFVLFHLGEWHQAVQACHVALPLIRAANDRVGEVRLLLSRGISYLGAGALHEAAADFIASRQLANEIGETILFALSEQDLGCVYGRMGDIPNALAAFDRARSGYQSHGGASRLLTILEADLAETLILAGLVTEAADAAQRSAEEAVTSGNVVNEAEARLIMARALLADGKLPAAEHAALAAAALFRRSRRPAWAAFARFVALQAQATLGETVARPKIVQDRAAKLARELAAHGWEAESLYARTFVGRLALQRGDIAGAQLELSLAAQMRPNDHLRGHANRQHARALLHLANGQDRKALQALRNGLEQIDRHRSILGASELRAGAGLLANDLGRLGFEIALQSAKASQIFEWSERWRAGALRLAPVRPFQDAELAESFAALRQLHRARSEALGARRPTDSVQARIAEVERTIANRSRQISAVDTHSTPVPSLAQVAQTLEKRTMLIYTEAKGRVWLQVVTSKGARLIDLGSAQTIHHEVTFLGAALRRLALTPQLVGDNSSNAEALVVAAQRVESLLITPAALGSPESVTVVPSGRLRGTPFASLPSLSAIPVSISPSATMWLMCSARLDQTIPDSQRVTLIAGPDLPAALAEIVAIGKLHGASRRLSGRRATVRNVSAAIESSGLVHIATHGQFRGDNPMFSTLRCSNGPLTVYDIERLERVPTSIVLSACSSGSFGLRAGGELLGTAIAFLHLGTSCVIAPYEAVTDDRAAAFMVDLHRGIASGSSLATALAQARIAVPPGDPAATATAALFGCFGA